MTIHIKCHHLVEYGQIKYERKHAIVWYTCTCSTLTSKGGNKMKNKLLAVMFGAVLVLGACGGDKADKGNEGTSGGGETASVDAEKIVQTSCVGCHGGNLGGQGNAPSLNDVGSRLSESEIHDVLKNGRGNMPGGLVKEDQLDAVAKYLSEKK